LETGGDDYICNPFNIKELSFRVKAVLKRANRSLARHENNTFKARNVLLDEDQYQLQASGIPSELTATEFKLVKPLIEKGRV
tara:strand:- start:1299 stop:1544 length:246 start_codon:yes stop_codon:yes gene_type:complete